MSAGTNLEFTGILLARATARVRVLDGDVNTVPVLCFDVEIEAPSRPHAHVEQPFPAGQMAQCEAAARRMRKGARVTFQAPLVGIRLVATNVSHVHVHADEEEAVPA